MRRKVIAAVVVVLFAGAASAAEIKAVILKVEGDKVTFAPVERRAKGAKRGEEKTLPVAKDLKVTMGKDAEPLEGGLKHVIFTKASKTKALPALIVTGADNKSITEIRVFGF